ncbi:putative U-box domain-containing protein 9-like [Capsicum annuum]|nr:putative U-box domain-containing protein 9-like [Capsicum annuum]
MLVRVYLVDFGLDFAGVKVEIEAILVWLSSLVVEVGCKDDGFEFLLLLGSEFAMKMNNLERSWTYERLDGQGGLYSRFVIGVGEFIQFACSQPNRMSGDKVRYPCTKCQNYKFMDVETVKFKYGYFGKFKKNFYWDAFVSEVVVKQQWMKKASLCYKNFISNIKKNRATVQPEFVNDHVWEKWMELWQSDDCVKKSEINSNNHCGGQEVAAGTHTGGSITAGEHQKKLERYEEIVREKVHCESEIDQLEIYYKAAGGAKKKRLFGLGSEAAIIEYVGGIRVQEGAVLDPPPTNDDDDDGNS